MLVRWRCRSLGQPGDGISRDRGVLRLYGLVLCGIGCQLRVLVVLWKNFTYHKLNNIVSACLVIWGSLDIPMIPPKPQLRKYLSELGSIFPRGSLRSCVAMVYVSVNSKYLEEGRVVRSIKSKVQSKIKQDCTLEEPGDRCRQWPDWAYLSALPEPLNGSTGYLPRYSLHSY